MKRVYIPAFINYDTLYENIEWENASTKYGAVETPETPETPEGETDEVTADNITKNLADDERDDSFEKIMEEIKKLFKVGKYEDLLTCEEEDAIEFLTFFKNKSKEIKSSNITIKNETDPDIRDYIVYFIQYEYESKIYMEIKVADLEAYSFVVIKQEDQEFFDSQVNDIVEQLPDELSSE